MEDPSEDFADALTAVQEGDFEIVQELIGGRYVSVHAIDQSGCSLLHWAAINNRVIIGRLLIENGLNKVEPGGVLEETPLHWALRKKYYVMMELIFKHTQCDLTLQSVNGNDPLFLACKLGDINGAFLLLSWGANPNTQDNSGDTPLIWLLKNKPLALGSTGHELVKMLLRFGASPTLANSADGNTPLHLLCHTKKPDLRACFILYTAAGTLGKAITNKEGVTPYSLAVAVDNRLYARFLYDAMMFEMLPFWAPTLASALLVCAALLSVQIFGAVYGIVYWVLIYTALSWTLLQWQVVEHRDRSTMGAFLGVVFCQLLTYRVYIAHHVSIVLNLATLVVTATLALSAYRFIRRKAASLPKSENRAQLAERIIRSAPSEGTDEECQQQEAEDATAETQQKQESQYGSRPVAARSNVRFVKDSFTGKLRRVESQDSALVTSTATTATRQGKGGSGDSSPGSFTRCRTLGPKLCGCCLADRRLYVKPHTAEVKLPSSGLVAYFLPPVPHPASSSSGSQMEEARRRNSGSSMDVAGGIGHGEVIAIATHCDVCNACVIDQDHHSILLGNCVGKGNRRWYWLFLAASCALSLFYFIGAKYVQHWHSCAKDEAVRASWTLFRPMNRELCVLGQHSAFSLLSWIAVPLGLYLLMLLQVQIASVARETTFRNAIKGRYENSPPPYRRRMRNVLTFLYSGLYNITYPKTGAHPGRGRSDSTASVNTPTPSSGDIGNRDSRAVSPIPDSPHQEKLQQAQAQRLLNRIDQRLLVRDTESGLEGSVTCPHANLIGKSTTTTYIAPTEEDLELAVPLFTQQRPGCEDENCGHCDDAEVFSDYDTEFIESAQNNYATYYFQDSDEEERPLMSTEDSTNRSSTAYMNSVGTSSNRKHGQGRAGSSLNKSSSFGLIDADERL